MKRPAIGDQRFVRSASGFWLPPASSRPSFRDTMRPYLTGREVLGRDISPNEVRAALQANTAEDFLVAAAYHLVQVEATTVLDKAVHLSAAAALFRGDALDRARRAIDTGSVLLAPQLLLAIMKAAVLLSPRDDRRWTSPNTADFATVLLGMGALLPLGQDAPESWGGLPAAMALELIQNQHFNHIVNVPELLGRYQRIWRELPYELSDLDPNVNAAFEASTGVASDDLLLVGLELWTKTASKQLPGVLPEALAPLPLKPARLKGALDVLAIDLNNLKVALERETKRLDSPWEDPGFSWAYAKFRRRPVLRLTDGSLLVLSIRFLLEWVCGGAQYWETHDRLNEVDGGATDRFRGAHSRLVERYVEEVVLSLAPTVPDGASRVWFEEDQQRAWGESTRACDVIIDYGDAWVCIEIIARRPTQKAAAGSSITSWDDELAKFVLDKKAGQLASTIDHLRADESLLTGRPGIAERRFFPVVLAAYGFPANPATLAAVRERLATAGLLQAPDVAPLEILDLDELEHVEALQDHGGPSLADLLAGKERANLGLAGLDHYLYFELGLPLSSPARVRRFAERLNAAVAALIAANT